MKFKAKISIASVSSLLKILSIMSKHDKTIILHLLPDKTYISSLTNLTGTKLWCKLEQKSIFLDYQFDTSNDDFDRTLLEINVDHLINVLRKTCNAIAIKIKLSTSENDQPILNFEITMDECNNAAGPIIIHEIPVKAIPAKFWEQLCEPDMLNHNVTQEANSSFLAII
ncbi:hypothetical protein GJ496_007399 [Pomphorhynchus laevis]|nr:hypothetical protein GJ496_007399 [Pomphorhynchus laevis]